MASELLLTLALLGASEIETVRQAFELGRCDQVIKLAPAAVETTPSRTGRGELYRSMAICHFRQGRRSLAQGNARASLRLAPIQGLDPFLSPPEERAWFSALVTEVPPPEPVILEKVVRVTKRIHHRRCLVPLGYCHWQRGEHARGAGLATAQVVGFGTNIFAWWLAKAELDPQGRVPVESTQRVRNWTIAQYFGATVGAVSLGLDLWLARGEVVDGLSPKP